MSVRSLAGQPTTGGTTRCSTDAFGAVERTRSGAEESSTTGGQAHSRASPTGWPSGPWGSRSRSGRSRSLAGPCTLTEPEFPVRHDARPRLLARPHRPLLECDAGVHVAPNRGALPGLSALGDPPTASGGFDGRIERLHTLRPRRVDGTALTPYGTPTCLPSRFRSPCPLYRLSADRRGSSQSVWRSRAPSASSSTSSSRTPNGPAVLIRTCSTTSRGPSWPNRSATHRRACCSLVPRRTGTREGPAAT